MEITVNDKPLTLPADTTVKDLLMSLNLADRPCAVEVNKQVVPKRDHQSHKLSDGDKIEVVTLIGGG
ncbi:MAG TPA: sulfur carrier protein ThiS [Phycisphaeraceae bacterium]|nr:sulfur carrier protein ThiS [Phycisphaeraceae bacterium]